MANIMIFQKTHINKNLKDFNNPKDLNDFNNPNDLNNLSLPPRLTHKEPEARAHIILQNKFGN